MKKTKHINTLLIITLILFASCTNKKDIFISENIEFATEQTKLILKNLGNPTGSNYPRTIDDEGNLVITRMDDWTSGFFAGSLWYLFELTNDSIWLDEATKWTESLEPLKTFTRHHDLGFMMYCSYGNAYRLNPKKEYKDIIIESANSLSTRFSEKTQAIKSWNYRKAWNDSTEWFFPVIVDNMMNLELLTVGSKLSSNNHYYDVAVKHANSTMKNHLRKDFSSFHVVDYDTLTGKVKDQATCQGYSDNSTWARGQAWIIYGYTMMYRETKDPIYLDIAIKATDFYMQHLSDDMIPLWDFNVGQKGYQPEGNSYAVYYREKDKDVSAATIVCSALFELGEITGNETYIKDATTMLHQLASPKYRAERGTNAGFILKHSVGSIPHEVEIDKPLVYADYYFLEALVRYKNLN